MSLSPQQIAKACYERVNRQRWRIEAYETYVSEYHGQSSSTRGGGVRGNYADGRPALQDLSEMRDKLQSRRGSPNWIKPIVDDRVALTCTLPTITFDPAGDQDSDVETATLTSRVVRGQYEISQMAVMQTQAAWMNTIMGEVCYTLDPLKPSEIKKNKDPFAIPGVYINVQDPRTAFPRFGTGRNINRIQDLFLFYPDCPIEEVYDLYPQAEQMTKDKVDIIVYYTNTGKVTVLSHSDGAIAQQVYEELHDYGFCCAEWGINKPQGTQWGLSEIDQTVDQHRNAQALFQLAMDGAILGTFPPIHVHNPEHVGRFRYGPLAVVETVEDGSVNPLTSEVNVQVPAMLLDLASGNLLKQTGTSPIRQDMSIDHANTSGRAIHGAQGPMEARLAMSNILLGSALEWVNSKIAMILYKDPEFKKAEMSVHGVESKGKRVSVNFTGEQLGGLWRNHVQWGDLLGSTQHETLVMYLQLHKEGLVSGRKVLEAIGEEDPERLIKEAQLDQQQKAQLQGILAGQQGQPGQQPPPGQGAPTEAAQQNVSLGAGSLQGGPPPPPGEPAQPEAQPPGAPQGLTPFPPLAAPPGANPGGATPTPDIWGEVQQTISQLQLRGQVLESYGSPNGIVVVATDHRDIPILKTALKQIAEEVHGPGATVSVKIAKEQGK